MRLKNFLFLLAFTSIIIGTPCLASDTTEDHVEHADSGHGSGELNWFDFGNKKSAPLIALLINFAVLVFLVYLLLRKGLSNRFQNRKESLENEIEEARKMKEEAENALKEARAQMDSLDAEMAKIKDSILGAGKAESTKVLEDAKATGERLSADALAMVEQEVARLTQEIRQEVVEEVISIAEKIVREKLNTSDHERIFAEYLTGMSADKKPKGLQPPDGEAS